MSWKVWCSLLVAAAVVTTTSVEAARVARQAHRCTASEDCRLLSTCRPLLDVLAAREPGYQQVIRNAECGRSNGRDLMVCCPDIGTPTGPSIPGTGPVVNGEDLLPKGNDCGQTSGNKVVFGEDAALSQYPWMALLGYKDRANPTWNCGGALINDRYVLTAAHCVHRNFTEATGNGDVLAVRLGEHNTATDPDCPPLNSPGKCAPSPQDFTPEEIIIHSTFNQRAPVSDDIALIRLNKKVVLTSPLPGSVHPVCLPQTGLNVEEFLGPLDAVVAGWGATEVLSNSDILQAAKVPFANKTICEPHYPGQLVKEQVCFGGRGRVDSCFGDSGGPLFQTSGSIPPFVVLGIVSRGLPVCGVPGGPAVYTNVSFYRKWIAENIKP